MYGVRASIFLLASAVLATSVTIVAWKRRHAGPAASSFVLFMLSCTWWSIAYCIHWSPFWRPFDLFWLDATYLGVVAVPTAYLVFVLRFTGYENLLSKRNTALLFLEPVIVLIILWTEKYHGLFFDGQREPDATAILDGGIVFQVNMVYSYIVILVAFVLLVQFAVKAKRVYRKQAVMLLAGSLVPWVSSVLSLSPLNPMPSLDFTPFAFTITGAAFAYALFYYKFLVLVPVARDVLVEIMSDGVFVVDKKNRVVDINSVAQKLLGINEKSIGRSAEDLFRNSPDLLELYRSSSQGQFEIFTEYYGQHHLDMRIVPLHDKLGNMTARLFIFRDITQQKKAEMEIKKANICLQEQLAEIEKLQDELRRQAILDPLTGLYNRRYLEESLARELARAEREGTSLSILMLDIDHFKAFNDTYGHRAGDAVLRELGKVLQKGTREGGDISCRYGGEEFVIVLANTTLEVALRRAEEFRLKLAASKIILDDTELAATVSIGVASWPQHGFSAEKVLRAADDAMYRAKAQGRNQVVTGG